MFLAALDHNIHLFRSNACHSLSGEQLLHRKYSKRSKNFTVVNVKEKKDYPHIRVLLGKILYRQRNDSRKSTEKFSRPENDPKLICQNIGLVEPRSTADLQAEKVSRFTS